MKSKRRPAGPKRLFVSIKDLEIRTADEFVYPLTKQFLYFYCYLVFSKLKDEKHMGGFVSTEEVISLPYWENNTLTSIGKQVRRHIVQMEKIGRNIIEAKQKIYGPFRLILPVDQIELDVTIPSLMEFLNLIHVGRLDSDQEQRFYKYVEYMWEGDANFDDGLLKRALSLYKKAAKVALNPAQKITVNQKIGRTLGRLGNTDEALIVFWKLLENKWLNEYERASTCTHYAWIEYRKGNLSKAEEFYYRALESSRGNKYFKVLGEIYNGLGLIRKEYGHYQESLTFYQRALECWSLVDYFYGIQAVYFNIGNLHRIWGDHTSDNHPALKNSHYRNAKEWTLRCISLCQKIGIAYETSLDHILLSELFLKAGAPDKAIEYAKIANEMAIAAGNKNDIRYSYKALFEAYTAKGETALAKAASLKLQESI